MKKTHSILSFLILFLFLFSSFISYAQSVVHNATDDQNLRGYYDRPYKRYEAEVGKCNTNGEILPKSFNQNDLQSEASNQTALSLIEKDAYVSWTNDEAADGMVIRFSIPDNSEGTGTKAYLALFVDEVYIQDVELDSYWAWQYFSGWENVPYNFPGNYAIKRMRFDEIRVKLTEKIPSGSTFKLVKIDDNQSPYIIDFVELEPIPNPVDYEDIAGEKVMYTGDGNDINSFIASNGGKTIFIPSGVYNVNDRIYINTANTTLQGAGMWHTEFFFTAPLTDETYFRRGIESNMSNVRIDGLFLNTINNIRYYNRQDSKQVGKGLNGSFGTGSTITNVWAEHFECGAWIHNANTLTFAHCRFRNNYADGVNLSGNSRNSVVEHCSFRNNGDDDMASWASSSSSGTLNPDSAIEKKSLFLCAKS